MSTIPQCYDLVTFCFRASQIIQAFILRVLSRSNHRAIASMAEFYWLFAI